MAEMESYVSTPRHVKARRLWIDQRIQLNGRAVDAYAGMWIVEAVGGAGQQLLMPDDIFRLQFRPEDAGAEAQWNHETANVRPQWPNGVPISLH